MFLLRALVLASVSLGGQNIIRTNPHVPAQTQGKEPTESRNFLILESFQIPKDLQEVDERETNYKVGERFSLYMEYGLKNTEEYIIIGDIEFYL